MATPLQKEFEYFLAHKADLLAKYEGKVIVIKDEKVIGSFVSEMEAVQTMDRLHTPGTFLVQKCDKGSDSYTQTFHSRVAFA